MIDPENPAFLDTRNGGLGFLAALRRPRPLGRDDPRVPRAPAEWSARHSAESDRYRPGMHKALGLNRSRIPVTFVEYRKRVVESARGLATKPGSTFASQSIAGPHERRR